jgi:hypothetical protein
MRITGIAANAGVYWGQRIAQNNIADQVSQTMTLSVQFIASANITVTWSLYYPTAADTWPTTQNSNGAPAGTKNLVTSGTFSVTTSLQTFTAQIAMGANIVNGAAIEFSVASLLAAATITMQKVQLEAGSVATPFERIPYETEQNNLQIYQRYVNKANNSEFNFGFLRGGTGLIVGAVMPLSPPMRATPNIVTGKFSSFLTSAPSTAGQVAAFNSRAAAYTTITGAFTDASTTSPTGFQPVLQAATSFSGTAGDGIEIQVGAAPLLVAEL